MGREYTPYTPDIFDRISAAISSLCGSSGARMDIETGGLIYTAKLDGEPIEVVAFHDVDKGVVFIGMLESYPEAVVARVLEAVEKTERKLFVATATVSLGFDGLEVPVSLGGLLMAPHVRSHVHGGQTGRNQYAAGHVHDCEVAFLVATYDWNSGISDSDALMEDYVALLCFVLDRPVAQLGSPNVHVDHSYATDEDAVAALPDFLVASGCTLEPTEVAAESTRKLSPMKGHLAFASAVARIKGKDKELLDDTLLSYARAWLLAEPEPGMERYEDKSVAVMLWCTIVEGMSPPVPSGPPCSTCNAQRGGGSNDRTKAFLAELAPDVSWKTFKEIRAVRHKVAHEARRRLPGLHSPHSFFNRESSEEFGRAIQYEHLSRALARKAILHFVQRGGNEKPTTPGPGGVV